MFKSLFIFTAPKGWEPDEDTLQQVSGYRPIDRDSIETSGFYGVRDERLIFPVGAHRMMCFAIERRKLNPSVIAREVDYRAAMIEQSQGRKVGRRERADLKDGVTAVQIMKTDPSLTKVSVWLNPAAGFLYVDTTSQAVAFSVGAALEKAGDGVRVHPLVTNDLPGNVMNRWVTENKTPPGMTLDDECTLVGLDGARATYRYSEYFGVDVSEQVGSGAQVQRQALTADGVSFLLRDTGQMSRIKWGDIHADRHSDAADAAEAYEIDITLMTATYQSIVDRLVSEFGGVFTKE